MENADATGPGYLVFFAGLLPALPAVGMLLAGTLLRNASLRWSGIPVGVATGVLLYRWLGRSGYRRLEAHGPELLLRMRAGHPAVPSGHRSSGVQAGSRTGRIWFLPLYLPKPLQWPACFVMITLGLAAYSLVLGTAWTAKKSSQRPASEKAADK
jgi:ABC-2 type transport system permease protein